MRIEGGGRVQGVVGGRWGAAGMQQSRKVTKKEGRMIKGKEAAGKMPAIGGACGENVKKPPCCSHVGEALLLPPPLAYTPHHREKAPFFLPTSTCPPAFRG